MEEREPDMKTLLARFAALATILLVILPEDAHADGNGFTDREINTWPRSYHTNDDQVWQFNPRLKSDGSSFLLTWYELDCVTNYGYPTTRLKSWMARFSNEGAVLDPEGICVCDHINTYGVRESWTPKEPAVCAVNQQYWVFYGDYNTVESIWGRTVQENGTLGTPVYIASGNGFCSILSLAADGLGSGRILVAHYNTDPGSIRYSIVVPPTNVLVRSTTLITNANLTEHIAVSAGSNTFLVVYSIQDDQYGPSHGYWAKRVDENGVLLDPDPLLIATNYPNQGACDAIPYGGGWLVAYDVGSTNASIRGRLVSSAGTVSAELFRIEDSYLGRNTVRYSYPRVSLATAADGFRVAYSVCEDFYSNPDLDLYTHQYAAVYALDREFHLRSCDVVTTSNSGAHLVLARNDAGVNVGVWTRSELSNYTRRRLMGGLYVPENRISSISMNPACTIVAHLRGDSTNAIESTSTLVQPSWTSIDTSHLTLDRFPCIATFTNMPAGDPTRFYRARSMFYPQ
jgi:hypothetical protein